MQKMVAEISESDCCGNGCANCILDAKTSSQSITSLLTDKENILQNYTAFQLIGKSFLLENVLQVHFKCADSNNKAEEEDYVLFVPPGHHVMMRAMMVDGKFAVRPYSPYWSDIVRMEFKIIVNLKPLGPMSKFIREMQLYDEVEFRGPVGAYDVHAAEQNLLVLISQGVAVSPMLPIIDAVLNNDDDMRRIVHLACFRDVESVCFRQQLHEFNQYWNYKGRVYLAHENEELLKGALKYKEQIVAQRLDVKAVKELCEDFGERMEIVIAGTREFQDAFKCRLKALENVPEDNIHLL